MENPATWDKIQRVIDETICRHYKMMADGFCGLSLTSMIYNELFNRGWLIEDTDAPVPLIGVHSGMSKDENDKVIIKDKDGRVIGKQG